MNNLCWKGKAFKALSFGKNSKKAGRNFSGSITIFHRGGGSKKLLRRIDFQRKTNAKGSIERIEYDPNRSARIALVRWSSIKSSDFSESISVEKKVFSYILACDQLKSGDEVFNIAARPFGALDNIFGPLRGLAGLTAFGAPSGPRQERSQNGQKTAPPGEGAEGAPSGVRWAKQASPSAGGSPEKERQRPFMGRPRRGATALADLSAALRALKGGAKRGTGSGEGAEGASARGNSLPLWLAPLGSVIHNIELRPGTEGGKLARAAGTSAQLVQKLTNDGAEGAEGVSQCIVRLPSGQQQLLDLRCHATIGVVSNIYHSAHKLTKAGQSRWLGFRPVVRGVAMNPIDHPHGGRTKGGRPSVTPWGKPTKGPKGRR